MQPHSHTTAAPGDADEKSLASRLHARGLRMTPQREQVLNAVRELGHATPEQISDRATGVDAATVYRTLELLEELGLVKHAHLGHGAPSYGPAEDDHEHVVCHSCGKVFPAPHALVDALAERLYAESGFTVDRSHFTIFGTCAACGEAEDAQGNTTRADSAGH